MLGVAVLATTVRRLWHGVGGTPPARLRYYIETKVDWPADRPLSEFLASDDLWLDFTWFSPCGRHWDRGEIMGKEELEVLVCAREELPVRWRRTGVPLGVLHDLRVQQADEGGYELFGELALDPDIY